MSFEVMPPGRPNAEQVSTLLVKMANSASMQAIARLCMIVVAALFVPFCGISGWVAVRVVTTMDKLVDKQQMQDEKIIQIDVRDIGKFQLLDLTDLHLDSKMVEIDGRLNKRIDIVSGDNKRNADAIDNLKEKVYPMLARPPR